MIFSNPAQKGDFCVSGTDMYHHGVTVAEISVTGHRQQT